MKLSTTQATIPDGNTRHRARFRGNGGYGTINRTAARRPSVMVMTQLPRLAKTVIGEEAGDIR